MQITNITKSYSTKLNHALYGGNQYESSDHFCSMTADIDETDNILEVGEQLQEACRLEVNKSVATQIDSFIGGVRQEDFNKWLYNYVADREVGNLYEQMNEYQRGLVQLIKKAKATRKRDLDKEE